MSRRAGEVEKVYIQGEEIFRRGDIVKVKQIQQESCIGCIAFIDWGEIRLDTSKEFKASGRTMDLNSDAFVGLERVNGVE